MATVYKVEMEVVSHWASYPVEELKVMIKEAIEKMDDQNDWAEIDVDESELKVERIA